MPLVQVSLVAGRGPDLKERLIAELTEAIVRVLDAPAESVRVILYDVPASDWGVGGVPKAAR
jgi:4-oxalocrotonate tautomerase